MSNDTMPERRTPLSPTALDDHVEQRIIERANLGHLYTVEWDEDDQQHQASMKPRAAASIWRVVQEAIAEAGWKLTR